MRIAIIVFDQMTTLDFAGFYEAIPWMLILKAKEEVSWELCSNKEEITDDRGMTIKVKQVYPDLSQFNIVFIPGGLSTRKLRFDIEFISWIQSARNAEYKVSVCTGALMWGAAGLLEGKKATTNPSAYELLEPYCTEVVKARIVRDGNIITSGGASASIDVGLYLIELLTSSDFVQQVQEKMDYPFYRPGQLSDIYV
ncbi:DJ-1/PfpI family protein [Cohnella silvisoli]|uniref:DJ-1/PfpI family protein n=1 Tax=Cohnella silvisoli TaxID=2873699 RepID=A0ABV1KNW1_9BACL|nr:DJ-1/PfpI family protein [Cohnella silvisoli]MCD9020949.1 DJ-1/PfpI family protein [Cohnella silvisoli]